MKANKEDRSSPFLLFLIQVGQTSASVLFLFAFTTTVLGADWRLSTPREEALSPDTVGVGYREQIGERSGVFGAKKHLFAMGGALDLALQSEVLNRTVSGFEPHFKEDIKFKVDYREQTSSPFALGWVVDGESFRDRQVSQLVQLGSAGLLANQYALESDDRLVTGSEVVQRRGRALIGEQFQNATITTSLHGGLDYDEDLRNVGWGPAMQAELHTDSLRMADWDLTGDAGYRHAWLRPRQDANGDANVSVFRRYDESTVTVNATVDRALRDVVGTPQFRRDEWHGQGSAQLRFPAPGSGNWNLNGEWEGSKVNQGDVLPSSAQLRQEYRFEWSGSRQDRFLTAGYRVGFQTSRSGSAIQKDQIEGITLNTGLTSEIGDSLQLIVEGNATRTDTPDTLDYNDRDETRWHAQVNALYRLKQGLWLGGDGSIVLLHNKYLSKYTSSANRNTNTYEVGGTMTQQFRGGSHHFRAEAVVTYVLFDFELVSQPNRDVLSRRLTFLDSATMAAGPGDIQWNVRSDFEDRGAFDRSAYEQSLSEAIQTVVGGVRYRIPIYGVGVGVGVAAYERQPYRYEIRSGGNERFADVATTGLGPQVTLDRSAGDGWRLYGTATLLVVSKSPQGSYMQNNVSVVLSRVW